MPCQDKVVGVRPITRRDGLAKAMGGDVVLRMLSEFREMQEEARVQYARTDAALLAVNQQIRVVQKHTQILYERTRILFERTRALHEDTRVLFETTGMLTEHMGGLTTHVSSLAKELGEVKQVQGKMFGQMGRMLHHLADAQAADRKRIDVLEERMDGPGEN